MEKEEFAAGAYELLGICRSTPKREVRRAFWEHLEKLFPMALATAAKNTISRKQPTFLLLITPLLPTSCGVIATRNPP
jgi:hypothetical protein